MPYALQQLAMVPGAMLLQGLQTVVLHPMAAIGILLAGLATVIHALVRVAPLVAAWRGGDKTTVEVREREAANSTGWALATQAIANLAASIQSLEDQISRDMQTASEWRGRVDVWHERQAQNLDRAASILEELAKTTTDLTTEIKILKATEYDGPRRRRDDPR